MQNQVGIIGGLGPRATLDLINHIILQTPAHRDQEHIPLLIDYIPHTPDRSAFLLSQGPSPEEHLVQSIRFLNEQKVVCIICPCNTAHWYLRNIKHYLAFDFIDMIEETMKYIQKKGLQNVGLLATAGTLLSGVYTDTAKSYGIELLLPAEQQITTLIEVIYGSQGIKAGVQYEKSDYNRNALFALCDTFTEQGAQGVILGCTELPLCIEQDDIGIHYINPTAILAEQTVQRRRKVRRGIDSVV